MNHPILAALIFLYHFHALDPDTVGYRLALISRASLEEGAPAFLVEAVCYRESRLLEDPRARRLCGCMAPGMGSDGDQATCAARTLARGIRECGSVPRALNRYVSGTCSGANSPRHSLEYTRSVLRIWRGLTQHVLKN